jgi:hypothetical protein
MTVEIIKINRNYRKPKSVITMGEREFKRICRKQSIGKLLGRIRLGEMVIGFIARNPDPRGLQAIAIYQEQIKWLNEVIAEKSTPEGTIILPVKRGDGQVIVLETLRLLTDLNR